ncbi:MAG: A/G-specific adenine glycosylase [Desulforhopalus sp.]
MVFNVSISEREKLVQLLLQWFRHTHRDLPWRRTYDPYHVWISEIMLQQTQMDRGVAYFLRWIKRFADVYAVADAEEQEILKYWEGLGYYARARNLHKTAKVIATEFGGEVPCEYAQLLTLPGIGPYTAAAIASVAGNNDVPVIDANVTRVYARLFDIDKPVKERSVQKRLSEIAETLLPPGKARSYNQALMDLGGLVCTPKSPRCPECPVAGACLALKSGTVAERPVLGQKKNIITVTKVAGLICWKGKIFIQQRKASEVWGRLWEFPGGEVKDGEPDDCIVRSILDETKLSVVRVKPLTTVTHQYTHHKINLHCYLCVLEEGSCEPVLRSASSYRWVSSDELDLYAFPAGPRKLLEYIRCNSPDLFPSCS